MRHFWTVDLFRFDLSMSYHGNMSRTSHRTCCFPSNGKFGSFPPHLFKILFFAKPWNKKLPVEQRAQAMIPLIVQLSCDDGHQHYGYVFGIGYN